VFGDALLGAGATYSLQLDPMSVDIGEFDAAARAGKRLREDDPAAAAREFRRAIELWSGPPFAGLDGHGVFEPDITRLTESYLACREGAIAAELALGSHAELLPELETLVSEYPDRESLRALHMRALYRAGRQAEALSSISTYREQLVDRLGLEPSPELQLLELQILQHAPELGGVVGMGSASGPSPTPIRYSTFVGRDSEVVEVGTRLQSHRLVTLVGPGGIGKSSIAATVANDPTISRHGAVAYVPVETVVRSRLSAALADALGLAPGPGVDPLHVIESKLASVPQVVLLDGCESMIDEASRLVHALLTSSDRVRVLATSREPLALPGEYVVRVGGLGSEWAIQLFIERAGIHEPGERLTSGIHEVCTRLDGIPLAIELAAARSRSMPIDRLIERLDDLASLLRGVRSSDRHSSLVAALDWSLHLLTEDEKDTFTLLSMFLTRFDHEDAVAMTGRASAEDDLSRLVEVSLVQPADTDGGHRMLEPVRQYARSKLVLADRHAQAARRHASWLTERSRLLYEQQWSGKMAESRRRMVEIRVEAQAAAKWAVDNDEPEAAIAIVASLVRRLVNFGLSEGWMQLAVEAVRHPQAVPSPELAVATVQTGWLAWSFGRRTEAEDLMDRALEVALEVGDDAALGEVRARRASYDLVSARANREAIEAALTELRHAVTLMFSAGATHGGSYLWNVVIGLLTLGRADAMMDALGTYNEWLRTTTGRSPRVGPLGVVAAWEGRAEEATELFRQSAEDFEDQAMYSHAWVAWETLAVTAARAGQVGTALDSLHRARALRDSTGSPAVPLLELLALRLEDRYQEALGWAYRWFEEAVATPTTVGDALEIAADLVGAPGETPDFIEILHPLASALSALGHVGEACDIASMIDSLLEQTAFLYWDGIGERERWAGLLARCPTHDRTVVTLEDAFWHIREIVVGAV
jgi:predicted ATPase